VTHCGHSPGDIISTTRTNWCERCEEIAKMSTTNNTHWQEVAPGGLMGKVRESWDGSGSQYVVLSEENNGQELTITSDDLPFLVRWLIQEMAMPDAVVLEDWLAHEHIGYDRPERIVPEQGNGPF